MFPANGTPARAALYGHRCMFNAIRFCFNASYRGIGIGTRVGAGARVSGSECESESE